MKKNDEFIQVAVTTESRELAEEIAMFLVREEFAACGQVSGPITSIYRWQGKIETKTEWNLGLKTRRALFGKMETEIKRMHPYIVPQIVAFPIELGSKDYIQWLDESTVKE